MSLNTAQALEPDICDSDESVLTVYPASEEDSSPALLNFTLAALERDLAAGNHLSNIYERLQREAPEQGYKPLCFDEQSLRHRKDLLRFGGNPNVEETLTHAFDFEIKIPGVHTRHSQQRTQA